MLFHFNPEQEGRLRIHSWACLLMRGPDILLRMSVICSGSLQIAIQKIMVWRSALHSHKLGRFYPTLRDSISAALEKQNEKKNMEHWNCTTVPWK